MTSIRLMSHVLGLCLLTITADLRAERRLAMDIDMQVDSEAEGAADAADAFSEALHAGELDTVRALMAEDAVVFESGHREVGRDAYFAEHAAADAKFLSGAVETLKFRRVRGGRNWAQVINAGEIRIRATGAVSKTTETLVLEKRKGDWQIIHVHWSSQR